MLIQVKRRPRRMDRPHESHRRPITRRDFIAQGFLAGGATLLGGGFLSLFSNPRAAYAALANDLQPLTGPCGISRGGVVTLRVTLYAPGTIDVLSTAGYSKLGLPGTMLPGIAETTPLPGSNGDHTNTQLGLAFHADSAYLRGMQSRMGAATMANVNGAVIPARSENDTSNNPHNPLYGIQKAGADGSILTLCFIFLIPMLFQAGCSTRCTGGTATSSSAASWSRTASTWRAAWSRISFSRSATTARF